MKLTTFLLIIALVQTSAKGFSQITLHEKSSSLEKVFTEIKRQSNYVFLYDEGKLNVGTISIQVKNATIDEVLTKIFKGMPIEYTIVENNVLIKPKEKSFFDNVIDVFRAFDVYGRVVDQSGRPLRGATVQVSYKGTRVLTVTDENGEFKLPNQNKKNVIEISFVGYITKRVTVQGDEDLGTIKLEQGDAKLDEIQVIAYGTNTKRFNIGASTTVSAEEIAQQPVNNVLLALQGRVPGLLVTPNNGAPGASVRMQVRGQGTLKGDVNSQFLPYDQPLFIIDGIPFAPQNNKINQLNSFGSTAAQTYGATVIGADGLGPFSSLNPNDIESITVLKDADATSIYGTQGANGVILITTKKGKPGKTTVEIRLDRSVNFVARPIQMLNTEQYLGLRREAFQNDGLPDDMANGALFPDLFVFDQTKYTNWYKEFFNRSSNNTTANASISGGTNSTTFLFSGGYSVMGYNFAGDYAEKRYSMHNSVTNRSFNDRLTLTWNTDYSYDRNNSSGNPNVGNAFTAPPNTPDLLDANGDLVWNYKGTWLTQLQQYSYLKQTRDQQAHYFNTGVNIGYKLFKDLRLGATLGYSRLGTNENSTEPRSSQSPQYFNQSSAAFGNSAFQTISIEPQIDYKLSIGKGELTTLIGGSYKKNLFNSNRIVAFGYSSDALLGSINGASSFQPSDDYSIYKYAAVFGRLNYLYDQKYIINLTGRRDGSSNFGPERQFGNFGSAGIGWIISAEEGFNKALPFMSFAKVTANYGTSGTDGVSPYQFQAFWKPVTDSNPFQNIRPFTPVNLYNPDYSWSLKKTLSLGLNVGFFQNRLLIDATVYQSRNDNQLGSFTLPAQTGFSSVLQNFDSTIENKGLEITLSSTNINSGNFSWRTNVNIAFNRNKLLKFPDLETSPYSYSYILGRSTTTINGFNYKGVNPSTGLFEYYKANGEVTTAPTYGIASQGGDMVPIADLNPKYTGGLNNTFTYKGISLTAFFQFTKRTSLTYLGAIYGGQSLPGGIGNLPVQALDHWRNPGDISSLQRVVTGYNYETAAPAYAFSQSSGAYGDASYIRLKTVSLEYRMPDAYTSKAGIKNLRFFINAQNLLTITGYKVGDPESAGVLYVLPLQRTVAGGLSFNF